MSELQVGGGKSIVWTLLGSIIIGILILDGRVVVVTLVIVIVMLYFVMPRGKHDVDPAGTTLVPIFAPHCHSLLCPCVIYTSLSSISVRAISS